MPIVEANGLKFNVQILGKGPPLVMLHGYGIGNLASWYLAAGRLSGRHRVVLYDLRGHGRSEVTPTGYRLASMAADLAALADKLIPGEHFDLAGYSYGSTIALQFTLDHTERVKRLVLVDSALPPVDLRELVERYWDPDLKTMLALLPEHTRRIATKNFARAVIAAKRAKYHIDNTSMIEDACSEKPFPEENLRAMNVPTLCIYGQESECLSDGRYLARTLPSADLRVVSGEHHLMLLENPGEISSLMGDFLNG